MMTETTKANIFPRAGQIVSITDEAGNQKSGFVKGIDTESRSIFMVPDDDSINPGWFDLDDVFFTVEDKIDIGSLNKTLGGNTTSSYSTASCSHPTTPIFQFKKCSIYAGTPAEAKRLRSIELIIDISGYFRRENEEDLVELNKVAKLKFGKSRAVQKLMSYHFQPAEPKMYIDWPDMQRPPFSWRFVSDLMAMLGSIKGNVFIHCFGGHGRTGTLLCAIGHYINLHTKNAKAPHDMIQHIRSAYCTQAVETSTQILWLKSVGCPVEDNTGGSKTMGSDKRYGYGYGLPGY
jgi:hypothetical protein